MYLFKSERAEQCTLYCHQVSAACYIQIFQEPTINELKIYPQNKKIKTCKNKKDFVHSIFNRQRKVKTTDKKTENMKVSNLVRGFILPLFL